MRVKGAAQLAGFVGGHVGGSGHLYLRASYPRGGCVEAKPARTAGSALHLHHGCLVSVVARSKLVCEHLANPGSAIICAVLTQVYRVKLLKTSDHMWLGAQVFICK